MVVIKGSHSVRPVRVVGLLMLLIRGGFKVFFWGRGCVMGNWGRDGESVELF